MQVHLFLPSYVDIQTDSTFMHNSKHQNSKNQEANLLFLNPYGLQSIYSFHNIYTARYKHCYSEKSLTNIEAKKKIKKIQEIRPKSPYKLTR